MLKRVVAVFTAAGIAAPFSGAVASEYCVTCEGPPAMYRCTIDGTEAGPGKDPSVSLYCISQMAAKGRHASCGVSRGAPFPCPGLIAVVQPPKNLPAAPSPSAVQAPHGSEDLPPSGPASDLEEPAEKTPQPAKVPRTVEELAGQTVKSSKEGLQKAGDAIGGTAKKAGEQIGNAGSAIGNAASTTWTCITSLFSSCGAEAKDETPNDEPAAN